MTRSSDLRPAEEEAIERAVLVSVLHAHPRYFTLAEVVRQFEPRASAAAPRQAAQIESAVAALSSAGLLHRNGDRIGPTLAAVRMDQLLGPAL